MEDDVDIADGEGIINDEVVLEWSVKYELVADDASEDVMT